MRTRPMTAAIAATLLWFGPRAALADSAADARMAAMEARITQLEDKLATSQKTIDEQSELLKQQATPAVSQGTAAPASGLDAFLNTVQINGYVAASYEYSFNNPNNPIGANATNQFNLDHNTFNLDGAKIELYRPATNPGDAGFQLDLLFGADAGVAGGYRFTTPGFAADNFSYVQDMNIQYNWDNVLFKFGKWETLLGYEVFDSVANKNITHGLLFTYAIPLVHTGLQASGKINESFGWAGALVNGWNNATDTNDNKGLLGQLNYSGGPLTTALNMYYGADGNTGFSGQTVEHAGSDPAIVLDWNANFAANDALTFWANADWGLQKNVVFVSGPNLGRTIDSVWYGLALGTQYAFNDKTSLAVRGEYLRDADGYRILVGKNTNAYSLTATLAYKLTTNLLARAEFRYDALTSDGNGDHFFPSGGPSDLSNNNYQGLVQVAYIFD
ncbi:MAG TPA: outer membrane beta-barrel protein [Myxococcota bacterium]|nr:outer membrane beta-barrel protein [Myxococcota bacterium]